MSDGYTKLFSSITDSTIWAAPDATRLVWITMLAMADQHGYVGASVPGLAARARVSLEGCIAALEAFLAPDKWSRTPDFEGRRIAPADGGWVLLNHAKYRAIRDKETRREYMRKLMADKRALAKVSNVSHSEPQLAQAEAEAEAEAVKSKAIASGDAGKPACPHQEIISLYHDILTACPKIKDWTPARSSALRARWNENVDRQNIEYWRKLFEYIAEQPFLTGRTTSPGRKPFFASLAWIVKSENFTKIREGNYE